MSRGLVLLAFLGLLAAPGVQACSLALAPNFSEATLVPEGVIALIDGTYARLSWAGGQPQGLVSPFFSSGPVFSNDGRYIVHDDQEGLGADCSGHRYTLAYDLQADNLTRWEEGLRPLAATADGVLVAPDGLRHPAILPWGRWTPREDLDWSFLPADINDHAAVHASRDGSRIAITTRYTDPPTLAVYDLTNRTPLLGGKALSVPAYQLIDVAFDGAGRHVGLLVQDYAGPASADPSRMRLLVADLATGGLDEVWTHDVPRHVPWGYSQVAWFGTWLVATDGDAFAIQADEAEPIAVPAEERVESFATNLDASLLAVLTRQASDDFESPAAAIHVYARGFLALLTLQPGPEGWQPTSPDLPAPTPGPTESSNGTDIPGPSAMLLLLLLGALAVRRRVK